MYGVSTAFVRSLGYYGLHSVTVPALTTSVTGYYVNLTKSSTTPFNRLLFNRLRQPCSHELNSTFPARAVHHLPLHQTVCSVTGVRMVCGILFVCIVHQLPSPSS